MLIQTGYIFKWQIQTVLIFGVKFTVPLPINCHNHISRFNYIHKCADLRLVQKKVILQLNMVLIYYTLLHKYITKCKTTAKGFTLVHILEYKPIGYIWMILYTWFHEHTRLSNGPFLKPHLVFCGSLLSSVIRRTSMATESTVQTGKIGTKTFIFVMAQELESFIIQINSSMFS